MKLVFIRRKSNAGVSSTQKVKKTFDVQKTEIPGCSHHDHFTTWSLPGEVKDEGERSGVLRILRGTPIITFI